LTKKCVVHTGNHIDICATELLKWS